MTLRIFKFNQCPFELQKYLMPKDDCSSLFDNSSSFREPQNVFESTRITDLDDERPSANRIRTVVLVKKDGSLGFTLSKIENGFENGFYVSKITKEPASLEKIHPGDRILSVNGTSLDGLELNDAIKLLRSLPDLCEFKLEQSPDSVDQADANDSLNYQSETEDDHRSKKQLRHEVKIMLDSRNKDPLHNRLTKRKELRKSKDESTKGRTRLENESNSLAETGRLIDSGFDSRLNVTKPNESKLVESNLKEDSCRYDKENYDVFMKLSTNGQSVNESGFYRQSSVMEFGRTESRTQSNVNSLSKQNNLNKWRNQVLSDDKEEDDLNAFRSQLHTTPRKGDQLKELKELNDHDEQDSGFGGDLMNRTNRTTNQSTNSSSIIASSKSNRQLDAQWNQDTIQLSDIQVRMNANCLANENAMYRHIENALFFYVILDRIGWHGRLGMSLTDDEQYNDFRIVNTIAHGFSACIVKEIYPNSLAYSNGNIKIGDKLLEVNSQPMINKPVQTVIKELRKLKGKLKLLFLRKVY